MGSLSDIDWSPTEEGALTEEQRAIRAWSAALARDALKKTYLEKFMKPRAKKVPVAGKLTRRTKAAKAKVRH